MEDQYTNNKPILYALLVVAVFLVMAILFLLYDRQVTQRHKKMEATCKRTNDIVSSLFPANVRDRILKNAEEQAELDLMNKGNKNKGNLGSAADQLKTYMGENSSDEMQAYGSRPIADLFPSATVMVRSEIDLCSLLLNMWCCFLIFHR